MNMTNVTSAEIVASEAVQREAWRLLSGSVTPDHAETLGIHVLMRKGALFQGARDIPLIQFNKVYSFGIEGDLNADDIDFAKGWLLEYCSQPKIVMVPPAPGQDELDARMARHGFRRHPSDVAIFHLAANAGEMRLSEDFEVRAVTHDTAETFADVLCEGYGAHRAAHVVSALVGQPGFIGYVAWQGAIAVGAAALFVANGWGWLWLAVTLPAFRKRGVQAALLARRIADGKTLGVHTFNVGVMYAEESHGDHFASLRNVQRAGFMLAYRRPMYVLPS